MNPFLLMAMLYGAVAAAGLLLSALSRLGLVTPFFGLEWLQLHAVTLGVLVQSVFGLTPGLTASASGARRPSTRWDIWISLNVGLLLLLVGIPLSNMVLLTVGGSLTLLATTLVIVQLAKSGAPRTSNAWASGRPFYIASLGYLLLGAFLGTGLWQEWGAFLLVAEPKEVHVHSNLWGFTALAFAGLLVDVYPNITQRPFASSRSVRAIFWLTALGALGLVAGPWTQVNPFTLTGLIMHSVGTIWLLTSVLRPVIGGRCGTWSTGVRHIVASYFWLLTTVVVAPLIVLEPVWFPAQQVAENGASILVFSWVLQFAFAVVPYLFTRSYLPSRQRLGGNRLSLVTANLASVLFWASLFWLDGQALLQAAAFLLWGTAIVAVAAGLWNDVTTVLNRQEQPENALEGVNRPAA